VDDERYWTLGLDDQGRIVTAGGPWESLDEARAMANTGNPPYVIVVEVKRRQ